MALILTVDDEEAILQILYSLLQAEGHSVLKASDGQSAIDMIESNPDIELVISDVRMNPVNGYEVLKNSKLKRPELPVIMVTAFYSEDTAKDFLKLGAFAYLAKPFKPFVLLQKINSALSKGSKSNAAESS